MVFTVSADELRAAFSQTITTGIIDTGDPVAAYEGSLTASSYEFIQGEPSPQYVIPSLENE